MIQIFSDNILFHEYFNGENGHGLGASHQTGWTALVANLVIFCGNFRGKLDKSICLCHPQQKD